MTPEKYLKLNCRLILDGTHEYIADCGKHLVADKDHFKVSPDPEITKIALAMAKEAVKDAFMSQNGCSGCSVYLNCMPIEKILAVQASMEIVPVLESCVEE